MDAPLQASKKLHLGCGPVRLEGWINIDAEGETADMRLDLRQALPFETGSVSRIFAEHFIEHVTRAEGLSLMRECRRVLASGGIMRITTPDLRFLVGMYVAGETGEWRDMGWRPSSPCAMINEGMRLWGHQWLYDREDLTALAGAAGFRRIDFRPWRQSPHADLSNLETRPYHRELIAEVLA